MTHAQEIMRILIQDPARKNTQTAKVLAYLILNKNGITSLQAFDLFHSTRLAVIISDLRHKWGVDIATIREISKDGQTYARYVLAEYLEEEESA